MGRRPNRRSELSAADMWLSRHSNLQHLRRVVVYIKLPRWKIVGRLDLEAPGQHGWFFLLPIRLVHKCLFKRITNGSSGRINEVSVRQRTHENLCIADFFLLLFCHQCSLVRIGGRQGPGV